MAGTADKDYFLDEEGNVTADESKASTLLVRAGQEMSKDVADKIGSMPSDGKVARQTDTALVEDADAKATADDAKAAAPSANKKAAPSKNKGAK